MGTSTQTDTTVLKSEAANAAQDSLDKIIVAVKEFHHTGGKNYIRAHQGTFDFCLEEPCISVIRAYPDAVPAERRPDWIEGSVHLAHHQ